MEKSMNSRRLKRGVIGALIGASMPIGLGVHSVLLGEPITKGLLSFILYASLLLGFVLGSIFYNGFSHPKNGNHTKADNAIDWRDHDRDRSDFIQQTGQYTSMREAWDPNYQRDRWD